MVVSVPKLAMAPAAAARVVTGSTPTFMVLSTALPEWVENPSWETSSFTALTAYQAAPAVRTTSMLIVMLRPIAS